MRFHYKKFSLRVFVNKILDLLLLLWKNNVKLSISKSWYLRCIVAVERVISSQLPLTKRSHFRYRSVTHHRARDNVT